MVRGPGELTLLTVVIRIAYEHVKYAVDAKHSAGLFTAPTVAELLAGGRADIDAVARRATADLAKTQAQFVRNPGVEAPAITIGGVLLIVLWVMGQYIGRIHTEVKERPLYVVRDMLE